MQATAQPGGAATVETHPTAPSPGPIKLDPDAYYSLPALAAALHLSPRTVQRWRRRGRGKFPPGFEFRGRRTWKGASVIRWLDERQQEVGL